MTSALAKSKNTFYTVGFHYYLCHRSERWWNGEDYENYRKKYFYNNR